MTSEVVSPDEVATSTEDEDYDSPNFIIDLTRIMQISFLLIVIGAISSYFLDSDVSAQSVYEMTMNVCLLTCLVTSLLVAGQVCGSTSYRGNRQLLYSIGHKERMRTYNRELLRRGHLGYVGVIWISSFIILAVVFIKWAISGEI